MKHAAVLLAAVLLAILPGCIVPAGPACGPQACAPAGPPIGCPPTGGIMPPPRQFSEPMHPYYDRNGQGRLIPQSGLADIWASPHE